MGSRTAEATHADRPVVLGHLASGAQELVGLGRGGA